MASEPGKGPLDDPAAREHGERRRRFWLLAGRDADPAPWPLDDGQLDTEGGLGPGQKAALISHVYPDMVERRKQLRQGCQHGAGPVPIGHIGGMDHRPQDQTARVDEQVPLAPAQLLGAIVATAPPFSVVLALWLSRMAPLG